LRPIRSLIRPANRFASAFVAPNVTMNQRTAVREAGRVPGVHAAIEVARQIVITDTDELADRVLVDLGGLGNQDNWCTNRHDPANP
jgi:hypothetical protein